MTATSDIYEGMYIPKGKSNDVINGTACLNCITGAIVLTNIWYVAGLFADVFKLS